LIENGPSFRSPLFSDDISWCDVRNEGKQLAFLQVACPSLPLDSRKEAWSRTDEKGSVAAVVLKIVRRREAPSSFVPDTSRPSVLARRDQLKKLRSSAYVSSGTCSAG
jgi:hypothetical protein